MKPIKGYEGRYLACPTGHIWAIPKTNYKSAGRWIKGRYLKPWLIGHGYEMVMLYNEDGRTRKFLVHRLIAESFIPNPDNLREVNHKDAVKLNNRPENLEWVSSKENKRHAWASGAYNHKGEGHKNSKLTDAKVREIRQMLGRMSQRDIALKMGVSPMTISFISQGKTWTHVI